MPDFFFGNFNFCVCNFAMQMVECFEFFHSDDE